MYNIMSSANCDSLTSSLPIWIPCICLFSLTAVAKASSTMLDNGGESGWASLSSSRSQWKNLSASRRFRTVLAVGLSYMAFIMLRYLPSVPFFVESLYREWMLNSYMVKSARAVITETFGFDHALRTINSQVKYEYSFDFYT